MHDLVQKILGTCERVANNFLHPGANYTYMYNLHTVCKSAHVNGALVKQRAECMKINRVFKSVKNVLGF